MGRRLSIEQSMKLPRLLAELLALACREAIHARDSRDVETAARIAVAVQELDELVLVKGEQLLS